MDVTAPAPFDFAVTLLAVLLAAPLTAACDGGREPLFLEAVEMLSGDGQVGVEGEPLPEPIVARAVLNDGARDLGVVLTALIRSGAGSVRTGGAVATGNGAAVGGAGDGTLTVEWTLGSASEAQELFIFGVDGDTVGVTVTATAVAALR